MKRGQISVDVSQRLSALNFVCTMLIVLVHCNRIPKAWFADGCGIMSPIEAFFQFGFCAGIARLALPMFLVVSGFLMTKDYDGSFAWWRKILSKRIMSIYVPFVLWNVVAWIWTWAHGEAKAVIAVRPMTEMILGWNLFSQPACVQLWYFRALLCYAVMLPVLCLALRRFYLGLGVVFCLWAAGFVRMPSCCMELAWENTCYFFAGAWLSLHVERVGLIWNRYRARLIWLLPVAYGLMWMVVQVAGFTHFRQLYNRSFYLLIPSGCATLWIVLPFLSRLVMPLKPLFVYSLTVFALHLMALGKMEILFKSCGVTNRLVPWVILAEATLAIGVCMAIGWIVQHAVPRLFALLNGGRGAR